MQTLLQDLRFGARMLWKNPGMTVIAIVTLGLGIGANTAIFSLVNAVLLKPLSFHEPERLVMVWEDASFIGFPHDTPAPANYVDWKTQNQTLEDMAMLDQRSFNLTGIGEPEKISAYGVSANFFPLLGVQPGLGRTFLTEEDAPGARKVVVLSYGLWQRRFGGEANILNRELLLDGEKYTVVGVMPAGFQFGENYIGMWVPAALSQKELASRGNHYLNVVARMKNGVTQAQAQADISAIMQRIAQTYPDDAGQLKAIVVPLHDDLVGETRRPMIVLLVAVGFVLLIACANIANLLLARAAARSKEMAVRAALGASRAKLVRQLLTESVLLAGAGGVLGLLLAIWSFAFLQKLIPAGMMLTTSLTIDRTVLAWTLAISLLTGIVFGLVPAWQSSKVDLNETLKQGGGRAGLAVGGSRLRGALVAAEVALALVLLLGAGLLIQTIYHLHNQYAFFQPEQLLTMRTILPDKKYDEHAKRVAYYDQVLERVKALPGVAGVGFTTSVPLQWKGGANGFTMEDHEPPQGVNANTVHRQVSADYLSTLGVGLREGRWLSEQDNQRTMPVVLVNETLARQHWPGTSAIGKRIKFGPRESDMPWFTIIGVVADVRQMGMDVAVKAETYIPYRQITSHGFFRPRDLVIRTAGDPMNLVAAVRNVIHAVDPDQPVSNIATMDELLIEESARRRIGMFLLSAFAALALLLASLGIYGVLSYFVTQHTPEIGVRLALGAQPRNILSLVLRKGMSLALIGVGVGITSSLALTRLMQSLLFGINASDPRTFVGITVLLALIALLACWLPARRATKVDPMVALRCD